MSNQYYFLGTRTTFIQAVPKVSCCVNGALDSIKIKDKFQTVTKSWGWQLLWAWSLATLIWNKRKIEPKVLPSITIALLLMAYIQQLDSNSPEDTNTGTTVCCQNWAAISGHPTISNFYLHSDWRSLIFLTCLFTFKDILLFQSGKKTGMNVLQIFPEDGNMGRVLPKYLTEWTTNKVRKGKKRRIQCTYKVSNTSLFKHLLIKISCLYQAWFRA